MDVSNCTIRTRANLALHHLFAAFWEEILQNSLGVAVLTVAALESYANEMYFEGSVLKLGVNAAAAADLAEIIDRESILTKYSLALSISAEKRLDLGISVTQNVEVLIKLRNAVVHFRPEWFDEQDKHEKLSTLLQHKFKPSTFLLNESVFPRAWASHSFTVWALKTTVDFINHFHSEAGTPSVVTNFSENLTKLSAGAL